MALAISRLTSFIILVLIVISQVSLGDRSEDTTTGFSDIMSKMLARKVLLEITLDYEDGGANNRHDLRRGRPGIGVSSP